MSTNLDTPYGFAVRRNGSCLDTESECYATWGGFWGCCPGDSYCPGKEKYIPNNVCCPSYADCTNQLTNRPHCANSTWNMYYYDAYFCCDQGMMGFWTSYPEGNFGCSDGYPESANFTTLNPVSQNSSSGTAISTVASSTSTATGISSASSASSATSTNTSTSSPDSGSSVNTGAIAGGVVGGVAGAALIIAAIWIFIRRQRAAAVAAAGAGDKMHPNGHMPLQQDMAGAPVYDGPRYGEMQAYQPPSELGSQESKPQRHELA